MAADVRSQLGGVEILVNSAALVNTGPMSDDMLDEQLNVKLKGYLRCARAFAPEMVAGGWGRIINISGMAARQTGSVVGSVRNVAVSAMTKNLADEYGPAGVNVTVVHPGVTVTERTPDTLDAIAAARGTTPDDVRSSMAARGFDRPAGHRRGGRGRRRIPLAARCRSRSTATRSPPAAASAARSTTDCDLVCDRSAAERDHGVHLHLRALRQRRDADRHPGRRA